MKSRNQQRCVRASAASVVARVLQSRGSLATLLPEALATVDEKDRPLLQDLCYGTLRHVFSLRAAVQSHLSKPLRDKDADVLAVLLVGAYQLLHTRIPAYAAINSSVQAVAGLKKIWAKGLVNAVLRQVQKAMETASPVAAATPKNDDVLYDHPLWLIDAIKQAWPEQAVEILRINNTRAPMTLRSNRCQQTRDQYLARLQAQGLAAHIGKLADDALVLDVPVDVTRLPGFAEGAVSVQDEAAQLAATLLPLSPALSVLDACAAPGGKTCHLLEIEPTLRVIALDDSATRCRLVEDNLQRLQLSARVLCADASQPQQWWKQQCGGDLFDRILVDAPCSATGVIRHHPDIKSLRRASDIPTLSTVQGALLSALWPLLKDDGYLLYVTCSVLPAENDAVIECFLQAEPTACVDRIEASWGLATRHGRQLLPEEKGHDGFYYCRLRKSAR